MFMVTTQDGNRTSAAKDGLTQKQADADAKARNAKAEALGIVTRYKVTEFVPSPM